MLSVIALGGNALLQHGEKGTLSEQVANAERAVSGIAALARRGERIVLTHGNGPQVGNILLQQATGTALPLNACGAQSQGLIGYILQKALLNRGIKSATMITQVLVDPHDRAFDEPTKPVGPFYEQPAEGRAFEQGKGWRLVVPSPEPKRIIEIDAIRALAERFVVIACGGGGIPLAMVGDKYAGSDAVIDKDLCAELLARELKADRLIILTDVDGVYFDRGTPKAKIVSELTTSDARANAHQFSVGSMKPKVEACVRFIEAGGKEAVICSLDQLEAALAGRAGTRVYKG